MTNDLPYALALTKIDGLGSVLYKQLVNVFGSAENVLNCPASKIEKLNGIGPKFIQNLKDAKLGLPWAEKIIKKAEKENVQIHLVSEKNYPIRLKRIFDSPPIIFTKGKGSLNPPKTLAIVGTRNPSEYGKEIAEDIVNNLKDKDIHIISGLAYGIDIIAQKTALKNGLSTSAVLANSLDYIYPSIHKNTAVELQENGLLISETPFGKRSIPSLFIARNRIIAALSDCLILVESGIKGGGMVTASMAFNNNKEVYAVPGELKNKYAQGPNFLIQNNQAKLFNSIDELIFTMQWQNNNTKTKQIQKEVNWEKFNEEETLVYKALLENGEMHIDQLAWETQLNLNKIASLLLNFEFKDLVKAMPGKKFKLI